MKKHSFTIVTILYFLLNIINAYFLTSSVLNRYILSFTHNWTSEITSIIGNFAVLGIIYYIGALIFKKEKPITIFLTVISFLLNVGIIAIQYYNKGYRIAFSLFNITIFKSPTGGFGGNVFLDWLYELFVYFRIICLFPSLSLLIVLLICKKSFNNDLIKLPVRTYIISFTLLFFLQASTYIYYEASLQKNWKYSTDYAQYGCQYAGCYNYYAGEFLLHIDNRNIKDDADLEKITKELNEYNKNTESYTNVIDNKKYSNKDEQTGILKGKNIFVIQMESTMSFCFNKTINNIEVTPNFNNLFLDENCFYFDNVYTTVGVGNTSDAEFAFLTGLYPTGDMTIAWEYADYDFSLPALGNILSDYASYSYNGTDENFYNHENVHEGLYGIKSFRGLDTFESIYPKKDKNNSKYYLNYWISDLSILSWARDTQKKENKNGNKCFTFLETITPHNPFYDLSYSEDNLYADFLPNYTTNGIYKKNDYDLPATSYQLENYLNQVNFNDYILTSFLNDVTNPNSPHYLENTVFLLYGDHGNALTKSSYEKLYKKELTDLEYRKLLLNIPVIFYDPTGTIKETIKNTNTLSMIKSNTDMHRTLLNLLGSNTSEAYFGVNMFSGEPSYTYDPKNSDIITDTFMYNHKRNDYMESTTNAFNRDVVNHILNYRTIQDDFINTLVYKSKKK